MRKTLLVLTAALTLSAAAGARAAEGTALPHENWSFEGVFGTFDPAALQRGYQVYREVCSACHSMNQLHYRNLEDIGFSEDQVKAIASNYTVTENGKDRPAKPHDAFVPPFPSEDAAREANGGALPPDLSLIVKARAGGADYVYGILTGFEEPPAGVKVRPGMHYNKVFPGHQIAMPPPLAEGSVSYDDGTKATVPQMAHDVTTFLAWASEPTLEARKRLGVKVVLFLIVLAGLLYAVKKRVWSDVH